jgi:hypothetical protein
MDFVCPRGFNNNNNKRYHYTSPFLGPSILATGLRMSTQGQGDGGVYLSTRGPASYGLGSDLYEANIIGKKKEKRRKGGLKQGKQKKSKAKTDLFLR